MATLLDGKVIAAEIRRDLEVSIASLRKLGVIPKLVMILLGEDSASERYVKSKAKMASSLGMEAKVHRLPTTVSESELLAEILTLNESDDVDGILVQLPLPDGIHADGILAAVRPDKDVDGFHPYSVGRYASGRPLVWPCTAAGIVEILDRRNIVIEGKTAVVIGRSQLVGWPTAQFLLQRNATVIQCHSRTPRLMEFTQQADILVSAVGQAGLISSRHIKPGCTIIDVGMNRIDGRLVGDVDFSDVVDKVAAITPVPGGVGPLTVTMLMHNTVHLAALRRA